MNYSHTSTTLESDIPSHLCRDGSISFKTDDNAAMGIWHPVARIVLVVSHEL